MSSQTQNKTIELRVREPTNLEKWRYTLITTFIFLVISNPVTYVFVNATVGSLLGRKISNSTGCPTIFGMIVHAIVFTIILRAIM